MLTLLSSQRGLESSDREKRRKIDELFASINGKPGSGDGLHARLRVVESMWNEIKVAALGSDKHSLKSEVEKLREDIQHMHDALGVYKIQNSKAPTDEKSERSSTTILVTLITAISGLALGIFSNADKIATAFEKMWAKDTRTFEDRLRGDIAKDKRGPRAKVVKKKVQAIEAEAQRMREGGE